jgi:hypothetical protein
MISSDEPPRQRNLWVTDAFEWRPEVRPRGRRRRIARTQLFVLLASWRWNQLAPRGKRYAVSQVLVGGGAPASLRRGSGSFPVRSCGPARRLIETLTGKEKRLSPGAPSSATISR